MLENKLITISIYVFSFKNSQVKQQEIVGSTYRFIKSISPKHYVVGT